MRSLIGTNISRPITGEPAGVGQTSSSASGYTTSI
jgi:hypothetical protein